ncbi:hypothetical protein R6Q57_000889 [Mikania cordata]
MHLDFIIICGIKTLSSLGPRVLIPVLSILFSLWKRLYKFAEKMKRYGETQGSGTILAIGTANPPHCYYQSNYPDYYFRVTKSEHMA